MAISDPESQPLTEDSSNSRRSQTFSSLSERPSSSVSTSSLVLENLGERMLLSNKRPAPYRDDGDYYEDGDEDHPDRFKREFQELDLEDAPVYPVRPADAKYRRWLYVLTTICLAGWLAALVLFISRGSYKHRSTVPHDPEATTVAGSGRGKKVTIDQVLNGDWRATQRGISWIAGPNGEDGMLLRKAGYFDDGADYLVVEDIRSQEEGSNALANSTITLMKKDGFQYNGTFIGVSEVWPSPDLKSVLVMSDKRSNWRYSFTGKYWLFDVESQSGEPLDPTVDQSSEDSRIKLATWSPNSDYVVFTRSNNMFLRKWEKGVEDPEIVQITADGGPEMFNGVPDWVYEEEVFASNRATWISHDGKYIAFLATNETAVPEFPVQYFLSNPTGEPEEEYLERYPDERLIKYPKAGAPNPTVHLRFYNVEEQKLFSVPIENDFEDLDRLITEVIWAGDDGHVLIRESDRESDISKMVLIDVPSGAGKVVRSRNMKELDGGWVEISQTTTFVPKDPSNNRPDDGYIDTIVHEGFNHLAYFTPLNNSEPRILTSGEWEVVDAPSAVDLSNNFVYFTATKESSIERHAYKISLDGTDLTSVTDNSVEGYYRVSYSTGAGYALVSYKGPKIPWQKVISTPGNDMKFEHILEENKLLAQMAAEHELPRKVYDTIEIDGFKLNVMERRPPHFDKRKKYPVLFFLYGGPSSQQVDKTFAVDYQSFVASNLGYIVVTVDGRGTGFLGRKTRCVVRDNLGYWEAYDQIAAAKIWAAKDYVDAKNIAIWGWSYGGYMTLKTLEQDAGETFHYGMAVAPVTDWQFYDSIYTERWMHTPQNNPEGYHNSSIHKMKELSQNVRFLVMHGTSDDNVHFQNTLTLLDKLDLAGVENYDVHVFPDSNHGIYFHNANRIVYDKLTWWLVNAFNGEWGRIEDPKPGKAGVHFDINGHGG